MTNRHGLTGQRVDRAAPRTGFAEAFACFTLWHFGAADSAGPQRESAARHRGGTGVGDRGAIASKVRAHLQTRPVADLAREEILSS